MDFSLLALLSKLNPVEITFLLVAGALAVYFLATKRLHIIVFILILSAALVGTTIPVLDNVASLSRWLAILLLFLAGIFQSRVEISPGFLLFWGYVAVGVIFLFRADQPSWQMQRGVLLLLVAAALPLAYSSEPYPSIKRCLTAIALVGAIFALLNFVSLPSSLTQAARYTGFSSQAPTLVIALGGLLPFIFWGLLSANSRPVRLICGLGLLLGIVTLAFSGQRAGTVAGLIGLVPFLLIIPNRKVIGGFGLLLILLFLLTFVLLQQTSVAKLDFLLSRYSLHAGLSYRDLIWTKAIAEIAKNPFAGHGIGASETIMSYSFHNAYLEIWYNTGIVGLFLFICSQLYFFYRIYHLNRISSSPEIKVLLALALGYMLGFVAICIFESTGAGASNLNLILYLLLGVIVSSDQLVRSVGPVTEQSSPVLRGQVARNLW
jgi:O-antigen ligase